MKGQRKRFIAAAVAVALGALTATGLLVVPALATPPSPGTTFTFLAPVAQFGEIKTKSESGDWEAEIETKGVSALHLTEITIPAFGNGGWHSHPGPSFIIVKSGTMSFYDGDDPTCTAQVVPSGSGLFESGGDVHIVRNETSEALVLAVVQLLETGAPRRVDEPSPGNCPF
jgi:quercetin dioxygenase-like cupin family protein